ncbi:MAG: acetyl-CoA carboxylase biotin carboxyl carrier protein subunit [Anaerolineae bacterium]|nr:acetyl-CoA carboxylase biotin carboxyl carrier protein subunit [Anaerolineales bacterium]MCQ3978979.1 acetyl-CoA carboxylase biotin carboxyl carrier protein subunit [Anaerolineae bacterium]
MEIVAPLTGNVWRILVSEGDVVSAGDTLVILESMKMEINVDTVFDGTVVKILKQEGEMVQGDEPLIILD